MGKILVHEFITLDGVIEIPSWTRDYPFDPPMGEAIGGPGDAGRQPGGCPAPVRLPLLLGSGQRLFSHDGQTDKLRLAETEAYESGVLRLVYKPVQ